MFSRKSLLKKQVKSLKLELFWLNPTYAILLTLRLEGEKTLKYHCVCQFPCGKIYYNEYRPWPHAQVRFSNFRPEIPFLDKCGPKKKKIKTVRLNWNLVSRPTRVCKIQWRCSIFLFQTGNTLLGKFGPKYQNFS